MAKSSFRTTTWDPLLIIAQIISLQSLSYLLVSLALIIALALTGSEITLDAILSDQEIRMDAVSGWTLALVWFLHAFLAIPLLVLIVQRAKLILDFVLTMHGIHLVAVWIYRKQLPTGGVWWLLQLVHALIMTLGGEWACMRREMEPIMMTAKPKKSQSTSNKNKNISSSSTATATTTGAGTSGSSSSSNVQQNNYDDSNDFSEESNAVSGGGEDGQEEGSEWIHITPNKYNKRKVSDAHNMLRPIAKEEQGEVESEEYDDNDTEEGPLTKAMDKAKKIIVQGVSNSNSRVTRKKNKSRRYEVIPMKDVDEPGPGSSPSK